jgi:hypothetical protein
MGLPIVRLHANHDWPRYAALTSRGAIMPVFYRRPPLGSRVVALGVGFEDYFAGGNRLATVGHCSVDLNPTRPGPTATDGGDDSADQQQDPSGLSL